MGPRPRLSWIVASLALAFTGGLGLGATPAPAVARPDAPLARLTVEISWTTLPLPAPPITPLPPLPLAELELTEGQVVEVIAWPGGPGVEPPTHGPRPGTPWRLGNGVNGRVRARLEVTSGASIIVRAGGQTAQFPIATILEGTPPPPTPGTTAIQVERLAWDTLEVHLGDAGTPGHDGTVPPGATVPVSVGLNVLTAEPGEVALHLTAELRPARGGEPVWKEEARETLATDISPPPTHSFSVVAPKIEGTYFLDLHATWEPTARASEGTRLGRWVRRHRGTTAASASRRVVLTVVDDRPPTPPTPSKAETVVDSPDPNRPRGSRPMASGRSPAAGNLSRGAWAIPPAALVEADLRDRLRGWITRGDGESATLGPADTSGLAWTALGLRVPHPDRPHRLTLKVVGGHPSALGVAVVAPGIGGSRPRVVLDASASAPPILDGGTPATFSWLIWPGAAEPVLVVVNRGGEATVRLGPAELQELADLPPPPALTEPPADQRRALGLVLNGTDPLDRFAGAAPDDAFAAARNLASYLIYSGASTVILPDGPGRPRPSRLARRPGGRGRHRARPPGPDPPSACPTRPECLGRGAGRRSPARPPRAGFTRSPDPRPGSPRPPGPA